MPSSGPEPEIVFTEEQWAAIAKSISRQNIPPKEKLDIVIALMKFDFDRVCNERAIDETKSKSTRRRVDPRAKGRAALVNFIKYTRGLGQAITSVGNYLKTENLITEAQELAERIYAFEKLAQQELGKKTSGGRPGQQIRDKLVFRLAVIYERLTGNKPRRSVDREGQVSGPFTRFVSAIFQIKSISKSGLSKAIEKAVSVC